MQVALTDLERQQLRHLQKQRRDDEGYAKVTVVLMLDAGWGAGGASAGPGNYAAVGKADFNYFWPG